MPEITEILHVFSSQRETLKLFLSFCVFLVPFVAAVVALVCLWQRFYHLEMPEWKKSENLEFSKKVKTSSFPHFDLAYDTAQMWVIRIDFWFYTSVPAPTGIDALLQKGGAIRPPGWLGPSVSLRSQEGNDTAAWVYISMTLDNLVFLYLGVSIHKTGVIWVSTSCGCCWESSWVNKCTNIEVGNGCYHCLHFK